MRGALSAWGVDPRGSFERFTDVDGRNWDDLVNGAVAGPEGRLALVNGLRRVIDACDEVFMWYASFHDDIPTYQDRRAFLAAIEQQVKNGELEPCGRLYPARDPADS